MNQAYIDALNLKVSNIRVNQAGYLPSDPAKLFYYVSDKCESATYSVVDLEGEEVAAGGKFSAFGKIDQTVRVVKAYVNSLDKRYTVEKTAPEAKVCAGKLAELAALPTDKRLRIKVGKEYSSTFIVSDKVYSMVRDANLKFFGVQRSGDSESWFHGPSHVHDSIPGGWYDAGDFLKVAPTMGYTFLVLSVLSAVHPERDEDHYAFNHNEIVKTDGIPDMLREARHGAEFYLRSYEYAKGEIKDMIVLACRRRLQQALPC
ncbi:glycoside hydrolase family 9 protein [Fibrobacter succinogenes]|uniref:glycoside hydrolase family 9 protein n=1 Tax=Fibrobacter succinogenes TaxID=833 RepID=UPI0013D2B8E3|nr:glycoside hydrolase family 9 protein [Fibrobacter succinogenes]